MRTFTAVLLLAGAAWAQQQQDPNRATDFQVNRLKDRLGLSDEQTAKVREIITKDTEERGKMDESRTGKINEVLNDEQKKQYAELQQQRRAFGGGAQGGQPGQGFRGFGGGALQGGQLQFDDLKRELSLTDEQSEKIKPIVDEFAEGMRKRFEDLRQGGFQGLNWQEEMKKFTDSITEIGNKVKAHLNDDQKKKYGELVDQRMQGLQALQNFGGGAFGGGARAAAAPSRPSVEDRVRRVMEALKLENAAERKAVSDLVTKIIQAQYDLEDWTKGAKDRLSETAKNKELSDAAVEDRLKEHLEERRKREKDLAGLQKELAEIVSNRQELELISQGVLR